MIVRISDEQCAKLIKASNRTHYLKLLFGANWVGLEYDDPANLWALEVLTSPESCTNSA